VLEAEGKKPIGASKDREWKKKDSKTSTIILGLCGKEALNYILTKETAGLRWKTLERLYIPRGIQQLNSKIEAFSSYSVSKGSTKKVAEIVSDLSILQEDIGLIDPVKMLSEKQKLEVFYKAIYTYDSRFDALIIQLKLKEKPLDFASIVEFLAEYKREIGPKENTKEGALSIQTQGNQKGK
jgi:hypothetical protein